jgi:hypothetical protein
VFIGAQIAGGAVAVAAIRVLYPGITPAEASEVTVPRNSAEHAGANASAGPRQHHP